MSRYRHHPTGFPCTDLRITEVGLPAGQLFRRLATPMFTDSVRGALLVSGLASTSALRLRTPDVVPEPGRLARVNVRATRERSTERPHPSFASVSRRSLSSKIAPSGAEARSSASRLAARRVRPDVCLADICSLRLLARSKRAPASRFAIHRERWMNGFRVHARPSASVGVTRLCRSAREGSARSRRILPRALGWNRTSDAPSQRRARPGFRTRSRAAPPRSLPPRSREAF